MKKKYIYFVNVRTCWYFIHTMPKNFVKPKRCFRFEIEIQSIAMPPCGAITCPSKKS